MEKPRTEPLETLPMLPPLPGWIVSAPSEPPEAAAFRSGAALAHLALAQFAQAKAILLEAIAELPLIVDQPNYPYLYQSLHKHLEDANNGRDPSQP